MTGSATTRIPTTKQSFPDVPPLFSIFFNGGMGKLSDAESLIILKLTHTGLERTTLVCTEGFLQQGSLDRIRAEEDLCRMLLPDQARGA